MSAVPEIPINRTKDQQFHNTNKWRVPPKSANKQWYRGFKSLIATGNIQAEPQ
jgi:hypothetical protein